MSQRSHDPVKATGGYEFRPVRLRGEIDVTIAPALTELLRSLRAGTNVEVDLSHGRSIDAAALTALLAMRRHLARSGAVLHLTGAPPAIDRLLTLVGLREVVRYRPSSRAGRSTRCVLGRGHRQARATLRTW